MSDFFNAYFCKDVDADNAAELGAATVKELQRMGLAAAEPDSGSVYSSGANGRPAFRPGPRIRDHYEGSCDWLRDVRNGMSMHAPKYFNGWSLNSAGYYRCPRCGKTFDADLRAVTRQVAEAIASYYETGSAGTVECPDCAAVTAADTWDSDVSVGFSHLAFEFYNWPVFNSRHAGPPDNWTGGGSWVWKTDVPDIVSRITGSRVGWTYGRL